MPGVSAQRKIDKAKNDGIMLFWVIYRQLLKRPKWSIVVALIALFSLNQSGLKITSNEEEFTIKMFQLLSGNKIIVSQTSSPPSSSSSSSPPLVRRNNFQFCNATSLHGSDSDSKSRRRRSQQRRVDIWYQCRGPRYDEFGQKLSNHVTSMYQSGEKPHTWGHRWESIPSHKSILLFGNSHTRQMGQALACHMKDQIRYIRSFQDDLIPNSATCIYFRNEAE